jgi:hypothetical protein
MRCFSVAFSVLLLPPFLLSALYTWVTLLFILGLKIVKPENRDFWQKKKKGIFVASFHYFVTVGENLGMN